MHEKHRSTPIGSLTLALALLVALMALPAVAAGPAKPKAGKKGTAQKKVEPAKEKGAAGGKKGKFVASESFDVPTDNPQGHHDWRWHLLTYPGTSIPPHPYTTAKAWEKEHVPDAPRWDRAAEGLPRYGTDGSGRAVAPVDDGSWTFLGPKPLDPGGGEFWTGRFNAVAVDPRTTGTPGAIKALAGAASGGLWLSTNCCDTETTWSSILDDEKLVTQAVGCITLDPTDPDVIYVGTGDFNAADQFGEGILKSTDGGLTWEQLAVDVFTPSAPGTPFYLNQNVGVIAVDPNNPSTLLAGTRFSLFLSRDAGVTWTFLPIGANGQDPSLAPTDPANAGKGLNRVSAIYLDDSTNPTTAYVAVGYNSPSYDQNNGVYRGTLPASGTPTFTKVSTWTGGGKVRLAGSRGNAGGTLTLYAQVHDQNTDGAKGTYVSRDGGDTWTMLSGTTYTDFNQDWYNLFLLADPGDDRNLIVGRHNLYRYTVDSNYLSAVRNQVGGYNTDMHPDQHWGAWITGTGPSAQFLVGNDGGLYVTKFVSTSGFTNTSLSRTVNATQWYAGAVSRNFAQVGGPSTQYLFAGAQDNGTSSWDSGQGDATWQLREGGDGMFATFDPVGGSLSAGIWMGEYYNGSLYRSSTGATGTYRSVNWGGNGARKAWSTPFRIDTFHCTASNCPNFFIASQQLWVNTAIQTTTIMTRAGSAGLDLTKGSGSVVSLDVAHSSPTAVVVGTSDGNVQVSLNALKGSDCTQAAANTALFACTANGTATWTNLTQANAVLPNRAVMGVTFDPTTTDKVYAAVGGFDTNTESTPGHVFRCVYSGGNWTWQNKSGNLPDVPAESVAVNPNNPKQVFVGSDIGFYYTDDIDAQPPLWYRYNYGLPTTVIQYLIVDRGPDSAPLASTTLAAFTYGRDTYAIRLPGSTGFAPHPVPPTVRAEREGASVALTFETEQCGNPSHNLYYGSLGDFSAVTGGACGLGNAGAATVALPDNVWFVVAGADSGGAPGAVVSHFGADGTGQLRSLTGWQGATGCANYTQQNTSTTCP